jgi:hypothetical protein
LALDGNVIALEVLVLLKLLGHAALIIIGTTPSNNSDERQSHCLNEVLIKALSGRVEVFRTSGKELEFGAYKDLSFGVGFGALFGVQGLGF